MIKNYGLTFLAFGQEHIEEFNTTVKCLFDLDNHLDIFVITDDETLIENKNIHIREIKEPFNYNLKRKSFEFAFEHHNIVTFMDTDVVFNSKLDLDYIGTVDEGMYVRWLGEEIEYINQKMTINDILKTEYGKLLEDDNIKFINEFLMILRIDNPEKRNSFIKTWDDLNHKTLSCQPNNGQNGSLEGLIVYTICNRLNIKIERLEHNFFRNIFNVGTLNRFRKTKTNKTLL